MIIIPEMFNKVTVTFDRIIRLIISAIVKRKILGIGYGLAIISEGVFHFMTNSEIEATDLSFTYDDHGHPELGNVSKAHIFNMLLQRKLKQLKIDVKSRPVELGYELRCVQPTAYDLLYCALLGYGVKKLFDEGRTGCMVTANYTTGIIKPLYMEDVSDENGKIIPRLVDIEGEKQKLIFEHGMQFLDPGDYEAARAYLDNPEEYDLKVILGW